jgi:putative methionine-R-sulfoxide reductase with GAF domain
MILKALDHSTQSWMAAPLVQNGRDVEGVLYCDSTQRDFFTEERQRAIGYAAIGIAFFVAKAYPS